MALAASSSPARLSALAGGIWPGIVLCGGVALVAIGLQQIETRLFHHAWLEALVLAILVGTGVRTAWVPGKRFQPGIAFSAKTLLEVAVLLLGASISFRMVASAGPALLAGIVAVVAVALAFSYGIGRLFGLPHRMAVLVAAGNSICGNSAIAAVAPVIGASSKDIAAAIAFTAVLGVAVVLLLPFAVPLLHLSEMQYGVLAGLTVYAVPQVLAATAPVGTLAVQTGTLVKLIRVLMLGPVVLGLSMMAAGRRDAATGFRLDRFVPWFILGFLMLAAIRSAGLLPDAVVGPVVGVSGMLTVLAMAALGLGVDLRVVARAGGAVTATVVGSLIALGVVSLLLIRVTGV